MQAENHEGLMNGKNESHAMESSKEISHFELKSIDAPARFTLAGATR